MNALHPHDPACPSRLRIDLAIAGELEPQAARELERHAAGCARCAALLASARSAHAAFPHELPAALVAHVHARGQRSRGARLASWTAPLLAAAGVLFAWLALREPPAGTDPGAVRSKGGPRLGFYVLHDGVVRAGSDGERVTAGDRLEFSYSSPDDAYLAVVSIDAAGKVSVYYGRDGRAAQVPAASRAVLEQSTELDETLGPETVYGLLCAEPIALAPVLQALERAPDRPPTAPGCALERIALHKVPR